MSSASRGRAPTFFVEIRSSIDGISVIAQASALLDKWLAHDAHPTLVEWKIALAMLEPHELAQFLESATPRARRMRISSPFVGLVK